MNASLAFTLFALYLPFQEPNQEPSPAPASSSSAESTEKPVPKYKRLRRGPAPTLDDLTSVEYEMNSDGTIRRRVVTIGGVVNEGLSDPEPPKPFVDPDPNWTPPEHSKFGSSDEAAASDTTSRSSATPPDRSITGPLLLIGIVGGLLAIGFTIGLLSKPAGRLESSKASQADGPT